MIQKIKELLKRFFSRNQVRLIETTIDNNNENKANNFKNDMKLENNQEFKIQELQKKFKNGEIKLDEMEEKDKDKLILLYINQIRAQLERINT